MPLDFPAADGSSANTLTPKEYADAVRRHSEQTTRASLYPGADFEKLAEYLQKSQVSEHISQHTSQKLLYTPLHAFASVYTWPSGVRSEEHVVSPERLQEKIENLRQAHESSNQIVFLRGQPSSKWLATVGANYLVNPAFFQSHLDFYAYFGRVNLFSLPASSSSSDILTLNYITLGEWKDRLVDADQGQIDSLRVQSAKKLQEYIHGLTGCIDEDVGLGRSIVRRFSAYDERHFALEQRITLCLERNTRDWAIIVWLDTAQDLAFGENEGLASPNSYQNGPWLGVRAEHDDWVPRLLYPTIQHQPHIALKSHRTALPETLQPTGEFVQSASLLHLDYGRSLNQKLIASDPFYAISELLRFCASSEAQLLNMIDSKLAASTEVATKSQKPLQLSNLLYMKKALKSQAERLNDTIGIIEVRGSHSWPRAQEQELQKQAETTANSLQREYGVLLRRCESLSERIDDETKFLTNKAMIEEAQGALRQAIEVTKLTRLASIYIPLSFTASFFGMNLYPLVSAPNNLWIFFAVSVPILVLSIVPIFCNVPEMVRRLLKLVGNVKLKKS